MDLATDVPLQAIEGFCNILVAGSLLGDRDKIHTHSQSWAPATGNDSPLVKSWKAVLATVEK